MDQSLFGLRFGANSALQPTREELDRFLDMPAAPGGPRRRQDLASFRGIIDDLASYERDRQRESSPEGVRDRMLFGVLAHSSFFHAAFLGSLEQYAYHLDAFRSLDFHKPTAFISSAEEEIARLDPKRKQDLARRSRLQELVAERRSALTALTKRRADLSAELLDIARYVSDNLRRVADRCETAIVVLVQLHVAGNEAGLAIDDVKEHLKDELRAALHEGGVTREDLDAAKEQAAILSREMASLLRDDVYALNTLYEALHDRSQTGAERIGSLLHESGAPGAGGIEEEGAHLAAIGRALASVVADLHFSPRVTPVSGETRYPRLLAEKRAAMLDKLFVLLQQERRVTADRRSGRERGTFGAPVYTGPERRSGKARRRSGEHR